MNSSCSGPGVTKIHWTSKIIFHAQPAGFLGFLLVVGKASDSIVRSRNVDRPAALRRAGVLEVPPVLLRRGRHRSVEGPATHAGRTMLAGSKWE